MLLSRYDREKAAKANRAIVPAQEPELSTIPSTVTSSTIETFDPITSTYLDSVYEEMTRLEGGEVERKEPGVKTELEYSTGRSAAGNYASEDTPRSPSPTVLLSTYDRLKAAGLTKSNLYAPGCHTDTSSAALQSPPPSRTTLVSTYDRLKAAGLTKPKGQVKGVLAVSKPSSEVGGGSSRIRRGESFRKFPDLPKDIRLMIWEQVIPSRVINLEDSVPMVERARMVNRRIKDQAGQEICISRSRLPDILFTCQEAFATMWKHYALTFSYPGKDNAKTYFNYERDILYVNPRLKFALYIREEERCMVQRLAISIDPQSNSTQRLICDTLEKFRSLKTLTLVLDHYAPDASDWRRDDLILITGFCGLSPKRCREYLVPLVLTTGNKLDLNMEKIEVRGQKFTKDTGKSVAMPEFDCKIAISASFKALLQKD